jgi:hypothetical protein
LEVCINTFHEWTSSRLGGGASNCYVPAARLYDRGILAKSGGYRQQHEHCKSQIIPSHVVLRSFESADKRNHPTVIRFRNCSRSPPMLSGVRARLSPFFDDARPRHRRDDPDHVAYWQCAPKARITSGGRFHPESCRLIW